jgi:hypothetical protein
VYQDGVYTSPKGCYILAKHIVSSSEQSDKTESLFGCYFYTWKQLHEEKRNKNGEEKKEISEITEQLWKHPVPWQEPEKLLCGASTSYTRRNRKAKASTSDLLRG